MEKKCICENIEAPGFSLFICIELTKPTVEQILTVFSEHNDPNTATKKI